jgi:hypothetical protein
MTKPTKTTPKSTKWKTLGYSGAASAICAFSAAGQSSDALINKLLQKGILTEKEAQELKNEEISTNLISASKWKLSDGIKGIQLYGDFRLRYEYRGAENTSGTGVPGTMYQRDRFRYAVRLGLRGDLFDNWYYGLRLETSANPRSTWITFGDDSNSTPSAKNSDGFNIGQVYMGWKPASWLDITVGRMPQPIYTTAMVWDFDINPEGAVERFKVPIGPVELFATFGQFLYQDTDPDRQIPSSDTFLLAWQVGANVKLPHDMGIKVAPVLYNYTGKGQKNGLNIPFVGQGSTNGLNPGTAALNQGGINDLLIVEVPAEFNVKVGPYGARVFGDFAYNFYGDDRARAAARVAGLPKAYTDERLAYQAGVGFGNLGLVYGQTSKKNTWEGRVYWQHVEQYALDVNLLDSDFFEGRGNLEGVFAALAYSFSDNIIGTFRYGYANRINHDLGTGGNNPDLPNLNPIRNYHILQLDLTYRF